MLFAERYRLLKHLGSGSFGEVWHAFDTEMDMDIAIKIYITLDREAQDQFKNEYRVVYGVHDDYLLTADYYGVWNRRPYLTMKYCERGSTSSLRGGIYNEQIIWQFIHDVAIGLRHLHSLEPPILHQDIKPANILIDEQDRFLLTDFGVSRRMRSTLRKASQRSIGTGALAYMAPERFINDPIAVKASDIWSLGASIYELVTGELPLMGQGGSMLLAGGAVVPLDPARWSRRLNDVVMACMDKETWDRPTAEQLVRYSSMMLAGDTTPWKEWFGEKEEIIDEPLEIVSFDSASDDVPTQIAGNPTNRVQAYDWIDKPYNSVNDNVHNQQPTHEEPQMYTRPTPRPDHQNHVRVPRKRNRTATFVWICLGLLVVAAAIYSYFAQPSEDIMSIFDRVDIESPESAVEEKYTHQDIDTVVCEEVIEVAAVEPDSDYFESTYSPRRTTRPSQSYYNNEVTATAAAAAPAEAVSSTVTLTPAHTPSSVNYPTTETPEQSSKTPVRSPKQSD